MNSDRAALLECSPCAAQAPKGEAESLAQEAAIEQIAVHP